MRHSGIRVPISFALIGVLAGAGCSSDDHTRATAQNTTSQAPPDCNDGGVGGGGGGDGGGGGGGSNCGLLGCPPAPAGVLSEADGAPLRLTLSGSQLAALGQSIAWFPGNPGPNTGAIPGNLNLGGALPTIPGLPPLGSIISFGPAGAGLLTSRSVASSAIDTDAAAGALGKNLEFDPNADPAQSFTINLLNIGGTSLIPAGVLDSANLTVGAFAAETKFVHGVLQPDQYRVAQADLVFGSPLVKDAAAQLYNGLGALDRQIEQIVNNTFDLGALSSLLGVVGVPAPKLIVKSNLQDKIFKRLLAQSLTSHNQLVTIDFSQGTVAVHLDKIAGTQNPPDPTRGLNNLPPNTELVNSKDYPLIATTVHDIMHDMTNLALGSIQGALDAVQIKIVWQGPVGPAGDQVNVTWGFFTLTDAVNGNLPAPTNASTGILGGTLGGSLVAAINLVRTTGNAVGALFRPAYDLILAHAGDGVFDLLINQIKLGFTGTVVNFLQPVFNMAAQVVSVQVNHQTTGTCMDGNGVSHPNNHSISALSIGFLQAVNAARVDFGQAHSQITIAGCH